jgi:hypothetical protein
MSTIRRHIPDRRTRPASSHALVASDPFLDFDRWTGLIARKRRANPRLPHWTRTGKNAIATETLPPVDVGRLVPLGSAKTIMA